MSGYDSLLHKGSYDGDRFYHRGSAEGDDKESGFFGDDDKRRPDTFPRSVAKAGATKSREAAFVASSPSSTFPRTKSKRGKSEGSVSSEAGGGSLEALRAERDAGRE
jgi:hypothetical protein